MMFQFNRLPAWLLPPSPDLLLPHPLSLTTFSLPYHCPPSLSLAHPLSITHPRSPSPTSSLPTPSLLCSFLSSLSLAHLSPLLQPTLLPPSTFSLSCPPRLAPTLPCSHPPSLPCPPSLSHPHSLSLTLTHPCWTIMNTVWNACTCFSDPEELIYDDVERGDEAATSSLDYGWSSSEFESYEEQSDGESKTENGIPNSFLQGKSHKSKIHVRAILLSLFAFKI